MEKLKAYLKLTSQLADAHGQTMLGMGAKVLTARARYGVGVEFFNLYQFACQPQSGYGDYMTQAEIERFLFHLSTADEKAMTQNKIRFHDTCLTAGLPTPPIIAILSLAPDAPLLSDSQRPTGQGHAATRIPPAHDSVTLMRLLAAAGHDSYIFKPAGGGHGEGVERFAYRDGELHEHPSGEDEGTRVDPDALVQRLLSGNQDNFEFDANTWIVQATLRSHPGLVPIVPRPGLCTFRIVTFGGSDPYVGYAVFKLSVAGAITDNFASGATGNFAAEVDVDSGAIVRCCGASTRHPKVIEPKTRVLSATRDLAGFVVPEFAQVCELAVTGARAIPHPASIGWDIALTDAGPTLLEANWRYDVQILQTALRRGLRTEITYALAQLEPLAAVHRL